MNNVCYFILCVTVCCGNEVYTLDTTSVVDTRVIEKLIHQNELLSKRVEKLEAQQQNCNRTESIHVNKGKRQEEQHVAFSAFPTNEVLNLGENQVVQFQNIIINEGNGFNKYTGVFTVPRSGVYLLSFYIEDYHRFQSIFHLVVNQQLLASGIADPLPEGQNVQGGNLVFKRLNAGDAVWVSASAGDNVEGYGLLRTTMFSGCFMYA